ncbi:unnamed protein product [Thelazia callipaeda]|uniref:WD_REPEATS_REGION domain-containing protein n=1 Tax=Thelazia callipaeda TaxID=103827 RepID=A0A158RC60_THECL|nr:unnamed protein product [Thelazia callipaeda]
MEKLEEPVSASGHDATVDTVGLMKSSAHKRLCISGARDRALVLWDTDAVARKMDKEIWRLCHVPEAHQGWIWNLCKGDNDIFYSCAWDRYVKQWQIGNGCINRICDVQMASAALCVVNDGAVTICSTFGRRVIALDARNSLQKIADMLYHRSAVFHLVQDSGSNYLYSCGEDRRIVCVDKRMWKVINELQLKAYAQTISLRQGQLLCGNVKGQLLSVDPTSLKILNEVSIENNGPIRQVRLNAGTQMCISKYRVFKVFTPGLRPKLLAESPKFDIDLTRFDYYDGTLAVACSNGCVMFWS